MAEQQSHPNGWTRSEKGFVVAALLSAVLAVYFATRGWRFGGFAVGTLAFSISWWSARRARIKGD
jgi:hypothetical protein